MKIKLTVKNDGNKFTIATYDSKRPDDIKVLGGIVADVINKGGSLKLESKP